MHLASFDPALVALPSAKTLPRYAADMLDAEASLIVKEFGARMLRTELEQEALKERLGIETRCFRIPRNYTLTLLRACSTMVSLSFGVVVGPGAGTFVKKSKGNKIRFIVDARMSNHLFKDPPTMAVGGSSSWSELPKQNTMDILSIQYDVEAYFYRIGISDAMN